MVPDKARLDHARFDQSHDDWYFTMLLPILCAPYRYRIYLNVKNTRGGPKTRKLHDLLANKASPNGTRPVKTALRGLLESAENSAYGQS